MKKAELIKKVAESSGISQAKADEVVKNLFETIRTGLSSGETITLPGVGTFKMAERKARQARNPRTGEMIQIPARKVPTFKFSKKFM